MHNNQVLVKFNFKIKSSYSMHSKHRWKIEQKIAIFKGRSWNKSRIDKNRTWHTSGKFNW